MRFNKTIKRALSLAVAVAVAATTIVVPQFTQTADAASSYKAYLCMATKKNFYFRNEHSDAKFANYLKTKSNVKVASTSVSDATFKKGKVSFTVSIKGSGLKVLSKEGGYNTLYVDTTLPGSQKSKLSVSKIVVKVDGKVAKTIKKPTLTPDPGKSANFTQIMAVNTYNSYAKKKCSNITKMPKKSISITVTGKLK